MLEKPVITISREYGSGGHEIGKIVAKMLGIGFYDRELIAMAAEESGRHISIHERADETLGARSLLHLPGGTDIREQEKLFNFQAEAILRAARSPCVIVGRCADYVLRGHDGVVRLFLYGSMSSRIRRAIAEYGILPPDAESAVRKVDKERAAYYNFHTDYTWGSTQQFDLCINTSLLEEEVAAKLIVAYVNLR